MADMRGWISYLDTDEDERTEQVRGASTMI